MYLISGDLNAMSFAKATLLEAGIEVGRRDVYPTIADKDVEKVKEVLGGCVRLLYAKD
jgi:hypothetical protein